MAGVQWARQILDDDAQPLRDRSSGRAVGAGAAADSAGERRDPRRDRRRAGRGSTSTRSAHRGDASATGARAPRARSSRNAARRPPRSTRSPTGSTPTASSATSGAEDAFYLAQPVPRLAANAPAASRRRAGRRQGRDAAGAGGRPAVPFRAAGGHAGQRQHRAAAKCSRAIVGQSRRRAPRGARRRPGAQALHHHRRIPRAPAGRRDARERRRA